MTFLLAIVGGSVSTPANGEQIDDLLPHTYTSFVAKPAPMPVTSEGWIPVSLRVADTIWADNGSHPPAAREVAFDFDRQFRFDMSGVPRCTPVRGREVPRDQSPCEGGKIASGSIEVEVQFPEQEAIGVGGKAVAYKTGPRSMMIFTYLSAPVTGALLISADVGRAPAGIYRLNSTVSIPQIAGGSGSLTYLGLRFRKGLFSMTCSKGRFQSRVTNSFVDGSVSSSALLSTC